MRMPGSGAAAAWEITARLPDTRAVMLTVSRSDEDLFAALRAGASGYLLKDMPFDAIADELAGVLEGRVAIPPELVARLVEEFRDSAPRRRALLGQGAGAQLTSREWQVLDFLRQGLATSEIARRLFVSPATVRSHVAAVLRKLRVPDREAAIAAVRGSYGPYVICLGRSARAWRRPRTGPKRVVRSPPGYEHSAARPGQSAHRSRCGVSVTS